MVKDIVVALLTVKINEFDRTVGDVLNKRVAINELSGILDYVADIGEEKCPFKEAYSKELEEYSEGLHKDDEILKKCIRELEETCEANNRIMNQQWDKIVKLRDENKELKSKFGMEEI